jgi:hypothetical protein
VGSVKIPTPDPNLVRPLERGWLLPALLHVDAMTFQRWEYWFEGMTTGTVPDRGIPRLEFLSTPEASVQKMLLASLDGIPNHGSGGWQGWSSWSYVRYFLEWLLYGFGHPGQPELPSEPAGCEGASMRLYQLCNLAAWMLWPYDYLGEIFAQNAYGKRQGFFPTPHTLVEMMTRMTLDTNREDMRTQTVCDPCVGTGRMLLHASNHSLRLYGMEIDATLCLATLVNGYLYAPWLVRPFPFLDGIQYTPEHSVTLDESMVEQALPHLDAALQATEHDSAEQWRFEPIKKRRKTGEAEARQGKLF